jgi:hypothetical protein
MKCGHYVKWVTRRRKGSGKEYEKAGDVQSVIHQGHRHEELLAGGYVVCDGNIVCTKLEAEDEPYFGGCSSVMAVEYACDKCGISFAAELPEPIELVNEALANIDDTRRDAMRAEWWRIHTMPIEERVRLYKEGKLSRETLASPSKEIDPTPQ